MVNCLLMLDFTGLFCKIKKCSRVTLEFTFGLRWASGSGHIH